LAFAVQMQQISKVLLKIPDRINCDINAEVRGVEI
jgi:hypothetical protein